MGGLFGGLVGKGLGGHVLVVFIHYTVSYSLGLGDGVAGFRCLFWFTTR